MKRKNETLVISAKKEALKVIALKGKTIQKLEAEEDKTILFLKDTEQKKTRYYLIFGNHCYACEKTKLLRFNKNARKKLVFESLFHPQNLSIEEENGWLTVRPIDRKQIEKEERLIFLDLGSTDSFQECIFCGSY